MDEDKQLELFQWARIQSEYKRKVTIEEFKKLQEQKTKTHPFERYSDYDLERIATNRYATRASRKSARRILNDRRRNSNKL